MKVEICDRCHEMIDMEMPAIPRRTNIAIRPKNGTRRVLQDLCRSCQNGLDQWWQRGTAKREKVTTDD